MEEQFVINKDLQDYLPPGTQQEKELLERSIVAAGKAHEPLIVWEETGVLVDGHRRHEICTRLELPYSVEYRSFENTDAVKEWVLIHQMGRRNLDEHHRSIATARLLAFLKARGETDAVEKVAESTSKSRRTVYRDAAYAEAFDLLAQCWRDAIQAETWKVPKSRLVQLSELPESRQEHLFRLVTEAGNLEPLRAEFDVVREPPKVAPPVEPEPDEYVPDPDFDVFDAFDAPENEPAPVRATLAQTEQPADNTPAETDASALLREAKAAYGPFKKSIRQLLKALKPEDGTTRKRMQSTLQHIDASFEDLSGRH